MIDYSWAMSIIFISFGLICMLYFEGSIPNRGLFFLAICMPIIGLWSGMTVANLAAHAQAGLVAMALGFLFFAFVIQSAGLAKSAMVIALWLPTNYLFTKAYILVLIGTSIFTIAVFIAKINPNLPNPLSKHFTAILIICAGLLVSPHLELNFGY